MPTILWLCGVYHVTSLNLDFVRIYLNDCMNIFSPNVWNTGWSSLVPCQLNRPSGRALVLAPLFRLVDELLAWNLGPLLLGHAKHWNGQKSESPRSWALSERQLQAFNNLPVYPETWLFHECSLCSLGSLELCLGRESWSYEYHEHSKQQFWHGLNLNCVHWL